MYVELCDALKIYIDCNTQNDMHTEVQTRHCIAALQMCTAQVISNNQDDLVVTAL